MGKPIPSGTSLLSEMTTYFDRCFIHEQVDREVRYQAKTHLNQLKAQGLIEVLTDAELLDMLHEIHKSETAACALYLASLGAHIERFDRNSKLKIKYQPALDRSCTQKSELLQRLQMIEAGLETHTSIGEIKTAILVDVLRVRITAPIKFFISDDKEARSLLVKSTGGAVHTCSVMGSFLFLRQRGLDQATAQQYLQAFGTAVRVTVKLQGGREETYEASQIFRDIYQPDVPMKLTAEGFIRYL